MLFASYQATGEYDLKVMQWLELPNMGELLDAMKPVVLDLFCSSFNCVGTRLLWIRIACAR